MIYVQVPCVICHKNAEIEMTEQEYKNFQKWQNGEIIHIQDAIPTVSAEQKIEKCSLVGYVLNVGKKLLIKLNLILIILK